MPKTQNKMTETLTKMKTESIQIKTDSKYKCKTIL